MSDERLTRLVCCGVFCEADSEILTTLTWVTHYEVLLQCCVIPSVPSEWWSIWFSSSNLFSCWWWWQYSFNGHFLAHPGLAGTGMSPFSLRFNGDFPGDPGFAGVYWSKGWWRWWVMTSYKLCKDPVKSSPPINKHPIFLQAGCPSCRPTNSVKALNGKISHSMDLLTPSSPGVFQLCLWPLIASG